MFSYRIHKFWHHEFWGDLFSSVRWGYLPCRFRSVTVQSHARDPSTYTYPFFGIFDLLNSEG
jgi:hypothetical protein